MATDAAPIPALTTPLHVGPRRAPGISERRIAKQFAKFLGSGYAAYLVISIPYIANGMDVSAMWWSVPATALIFGSGIGIGVMGFRGTHRGVELMTSAAVLIYAVCALLWPLAWNGDLLDDSHGMWFIQFVGLSAMACALVWRPRMAIVYLVVVCVSCTLANELVRAPAVRNPIVADLLFTLGFCLIPVGAALMAMRTARLLDETRDEALRVAGTEATIRAREIERVRFNALMHDGVMATLLAAARQGNSDATTAQARSALAQIDQLGADDGSLRFTPSTVVAQLRTAIAELDPSITVTAENTDPQATTSYPADAVRAIVGATAEATRNAIRHTATDADRRVEITTHDGSITTTVTDTGSGFDRTRVPEHRMGIAVSICGRMDSVGGLAVIDSAPGRGTTVTASWSAPT